MTYRVKSGNIVSDQFRRARAVGDVLDCAFDHNLTAEEAFGGCLRRLGLLLSQAS